MFILFFFSQAFLQVKKKITFKTQLSNNYNVLLAYIKFDKLQYKSIVDTGSTRLTGKGWDCKGEPLSKIKVKNNKNCDFKKPISIQYESGNIDGVMCKVEVTASVTIFKIPGPIWEKTQSIMGIFDYNSSSFLSTLLENKVIQFKEFSIYMTVPSGKLVIGEAQILNADYSKPVFKGKFLDDYQFKIKSMSVGNAEVVFKTTILIEVDTGTQYTIIPEEVLIKFFRQLQNIYKSKDKCKIQDSIDQDFCLIVCYKVSATEKTKIPALGIKFQNPFSFKPSLFLECEAHTANLQKCTLKLQSNQLQVNQGRLGMNLMKNMLILVDAKGRQFNLLYPKK